MYFSFLQGSGLIKKFFKFKPINQRFIPNLHRKTIINISIFRNQHPYLLFTNSKILNCFVNRQHILLPDWNHLALYSFFYIIYYEHLQIFKIGSTLSANDNPHHCRLSSADKNAIQVAGHYSAHIGLAPSFKLTGLQISLQSGSIIITDMLHRPVLLPHILSDLLAPYLCFNVIFQHSLTFTPLKEQVHLGEST